MHQVIRAVVKAGDPEEAVEKAKEVFEGLCNEQGGVFDYYTTFDDNTAKVSGKARYGDKVPVVLDCSTPEGKAMVEEGWEATVREYRRNMRHARIAMKYLTDDQILKGLCDKQMELTPEMKKDLEAMDKAEWDDPFFDFSAMMGKARPKWKKPGIQRLKELWRHISGSALTYLRWAGASRGSEVWLYDQEGCGIKEQLYYDMLLDPKYLEPGQKYYVVPADVHS